MKSTASSLPLHSILVNKVPYKHSLGQEQVNYKNVMILSYSELRENNWSFAF